jgi:hypothetical protein
MSKKPLAILMLVAIVVSAAGLVWQALATSKWRATSGYSAAPRATDSTASNLTHPTGPMHLGRVEVVSPATPGEASYTTRGRIEGMPQAQFRPGGVIYLQLHHEMIPEFVGPTGEVEGMKEMIMDFPTIAPGVSWEGLKVGDPVELTFEVRWKSEPRFILTRLVRLPDDVQLNLSAVERK